MFGNISGSRKLLKTLNVKTSGTYVPKTLTSTSFFHEISRVSCSGLKRKISSRRKFDLRTCKVISCCSIVIASPCYYRAIKKTCQLVARLGDGSKQVQNISLKFGERQILVTFKLATTRVLDFNFIKIRNSFIWKLRHCFTTVIVTFIMEKEYYF